MKRTFQIVAFGSLWCLSSILCQNLLGDDPKSTKVLPQEKEAPVVFNEAFPLDSRREDWVRAAILDGRSESWSRLQAERSLTQRVAELEKECNLTQEQSSKLLLAGRGDIANYFRDIEDLSRELIPQATKEGLINFIVQPEIQAKLTPLKERWRRGLHSSGSFYQGVMKQTLSEEQIKNIDSQRRQKEALRSKQQIMAFVVNVEKSVPFTAMQRNQFIEKLESIIAQVLKDRTAKRTTSDPIETNEFDSASSNLGAEENRYLPMIAAMKLTQADLESFLDKEQVTTMVSLQRHWLLNVPLLNAEQGRK